MAYYGMEPRTTKTRGQDDRMNTPSGASNNDDDVESGQNDPRIDIKLEAEFYSCAFLSPLKLGHKRSYWERVFGECFFTVGMIFVAAMQCITIMGMSAYLVEKDAGYTDEFKLNTALFAEGGSPMSLSSQQDVCGQFNQIPLRHIGVDSYHYLRMGDGTFYKESADTPLFHSYKMPSGSWGFDSISGDESYVETLLRVLQENTYGGAWSKIARLKDFRVEFGLLFVIMLSLLWYHVLFELRKACRFGMLLHHLYKRGVLKSRDGTTCIDKDGNIEILHLNTSALLVGCLCICMRFSVVFMMLTWGTSLLAASWDKLTLVLNSLAIGIVFELDLVIAYAVVDQATMNKVENVKPVTVVSPTWLNSDSSRGMTSADTMFSTVCLCGVFLAACLFRYWQVGIYTHQLHNAAALCLFAGPTPQARPDLLAPVPGFCESLLSMTCAPNVSGPGQSHGPCLVTNQNVFKSPSVMLYPDNQLFENMYNEDGQRQSMLDWGRANPALVSSGTWTDDKNLDIFRQACVQLYRPHDTISRRVVDPSAGISMYSAPFYCPREQLFKAVFGNAVTDFDKWRRVFDLKGRDVVEALDNCHVLSETEERSSTSTPPQDTAPMQQHSTANAASASNDEAAASAVPSDDMSGHPLPINTLASMREPRKHLHVRHHMRHRHSHHEVSRKTIRSSDV